MAEALKNNLSHMKPLSEDPNDYTGLGKEDHQVIDLPLSTELACLSQSSIPTDIVNDRWRDCHFLFNTATLMDVVEISDGRRRERVSCSTIDIAKMTLFKRLRLRSSCSIKREDKFFSNPNREDKDMTSLAILEIFQKMRPSDQRQP